jgi:hypothetical protein
MPELIVKMPTLHAGQAAIWRARSRLNAVRCGRRYGKTKMMVTLSANGVIKGKKVGIFTPEHKQLAEPYEELLSILNPIKRRANKTEGTIRSITDGLVDFWTVTDNELAGRGREYDMVLVDEGAFTKDGQFADIWKKSINPTMLTRPGSSAWIFSTPNGLKTENFFYQICHDPKLNFKEHYAPSSSNPYVPVEDLAREQRDNHPMVWQQEYLAQFVDWSGVAFFSRESLLVNNQPVPAPSLCDAVFVTIDTAVKTGSEHDATAVTYWAVNRHVPGHPLFILDWDITQVEGSLLEQWLPSVYQRLEELAQQTRARAGSLGAFIEDKVSGTILLQQARRRGWHASAIDSVLTSLGKDERAMSVSGYVYRGMVKLTEHAYNKTTMFKGASRNHFMSQVMGFRIGLKDQADDLLDTFTYGIAIGLGNKGGF